MLHSTTVVFATLLCLSPALRDFLDDARQNVVAVTDDDLEKPTQLYWAVGPQTGVPEGDLVGWKRCFKGNYDDTAGGLTKLVTKKCKGSKLLMACRRVGEPDFQLLAMGERADVLFDVGSDATATHEANGVAWYFSNDYSWGFAPAGETVNRNSCDIGVDSNANLRLCWHTFQDTLDTGFRCGDDQFLQDTNQFERVIFHAQ